MTGPFPDRGTAGRLLAERLRPYVEVDVPVVLALPRGGVPVAAQVAHALGADLDVIVARKIGLPWQPELGVGAVTEDGPPVWNETLLRHVRLSPADLDEAVQRERAEAARRRRAYRGDRPPPDVAGRTVIVVDDGLATGITARAALRSLRAQHPARLVFAVPVCARQSAQDLTDEADEIVCERSPAEFRAVGEWYDNFEQLTDTQVTQTLNDAWNARTR